MNLIFYSLKLSTWFLLLLTCTACNARTQSSKAKKEIKTFFTDHLAGKERHYNTSSVIQSEDIAKEQAFVWEAWKEANADFNEEKLIPTQALELQNSGQWKLPEALEPNAVMPYYWGYKGDKPAEGYPLFIYLHGSGDKTREWETSFKLAQQFKDAPSIYFIPQIPNTGNYYRWYLRSKQFAYEKLLRLAFINGEINPNKIYFFGISEGGYGSQRLASFYADYMAGAGPMAAGEPLKNAPVENCRNTAFSLLTGDKDAGFYRNTLTQYTKTQFDSLQTIWPESFKHRIELISDAGHSINYFSTTPWLNQFTRNPYPQFVSWENFEMDNRYRKGFYNITVQERSNDDESSRSYYELQIKGNNLTLKAELVSYETVEKDPRWGIELKFAKHYKPAVKGKLTIYLCEELVNLNEEIVLTVNGKEAYKGKVIPERRHMVNSCAIFFDPERLYPAAIEIDLEKL